MALHIAQRKVGLASIVPVSCSWFLLFHFILASEGESTRVVDAAWLILPCSSDRRGVCSAPLYSSGILSSTGTRLIGLSAHQIKIAGWKVLQEKIGKIVTLDQAYTPVRLFLVVIA